MASKLQKTMLMLTQFYPFFHLDSIFGRFDKLIFRSYMNEFHNELWENVLGEIQTEISQANYLTLFKGTALLSFDEGVATVSAPSAMIIDLLQKRFYEVVKKTVDKHTGISSKIIFVPKSAVSVTSYDAKSAPLFAFEGKSSEPIGHLPRVRA